MTALITSDIQASFVWGPILEIHTVGEHYMIVEYETTRPGNAKPDWRSAIMFHPYIDGEDTSHSYGSLDEALLGCVCWRHEIKHRGWSSAANSRYVGYIMRMIGAGVNS